MSIPYTLGLASPVVFDPRVKRAQGILDTGNVFGQDFLNDVHDGQAGVKFGLACIHAKDWLGYPDKDVKPTYGPTLDALLLGEQLIPTEFKKRQKARGDKKTSMRSKALAEAVTHIGLKESPSGSNLQMFGSWYGMNGVPWCAIFTSYCYSKAGSKAIAKKLHYSYVPYIVSDARAGRNGLRAVSAPLPGDLVCYDWDGGVADHVGLFEKGNASAFNAIEGNTAVGNDSNGGEVMRRSRSGNQVVAFVRVTR